MSDHLGDGPDMHGSPAVDLLRHSVELSPDIALELCRWERANDLDPDHGWPLRIDFADQAITYWPATLPAGDPPLTQTLLQVPRGRLWQALADAGALWCADPAHAVADESRPMGGPVVRMAPCQRLVDRAGVHFPPGVMPVGAAMRALGISPDATARAREQTSAALRRAVEFSLTIVVERAARACEHTDPAGPIYDSTRACTGCVVAAVMEFMRGPAPADKAARAALFDAVTRDLQPAGHWVVGHGFVPAGDPRAQVFTVPAPKYPVDD